MEKLKTREIRFGAFMKEREEEKGPAWKKNVSKPKLEIQISFLNPAVYLFNYFFFKSQSPIFGTSVIFKNHYFSPPKMKVYITMNVWAQIHERKFWELFLSVVASFSVQKNPKELIETVLSCRVF